jgi:hypothetical protein
MAQKPWYQKLLENVLLIIGVIVLIVSAFDTISKIFQFLTPSLITPIVTYVGVPIVVVVYLTFFVITKRKKPLWITKDGAVVRIKSLGTKTHIFFILLILALVTPRLIPVEKTIVSTGRCGGVPLELQVPANPVDLNRQFGFTNYNQGNIGIPESSGLFGNRITAVFADREGIWVGYINSDTKKPGLDFISVPVVKNSIQPSQRIWEACSFPGIEHLISLVNAIAEDPDQSLWVATDGQGVWHLQSGKWEQFIRKQITDEPGLPDQATYNIVPFGNVIYVATAKGLVQYNGIRWNKRTAETGDNPMYSIAFSPGGETWIGFANLGLREILKDGSLTNYDTSKGLKSNDVRGIVVDSQGNIWAATWGGGVSLLQGQKIINYEAGVDNFPNNNVHVIKLDPYGRVWAGTEGGTSYFDGKTWKTYNNLDTVSINFGLEDKPECPGAVDLWTGTAGNGLTHSRLPARTDIIHNVQISNIPNTVKSGETFAPKVSFELEDSFKITSADFLQATDDNPYTDSPLVSFENLDTHTGDTYTLDFKNNPFKKIPSSPGEYTTSWRLWECGRYVGPPITIKFTVK